MAKYVRHRAIIAAVVAGGGLLILAACQQSGMQSALTVMPGYGLHLLDQGDSAKLAYGQANSDNVGLMLECSKGSSRVEISDVARNENHKLALSSGKQRSDFKAVVEPGGDAAVLTATAPSNAPALKGFRDTGKIEVENGGRRYGVTATDAEQADVKRFFAMCERA